MLGELDMPGSNVHGPGVNANTISRGRWDFLPYRQGLNEAAAA